MTVAKQVAYALGYKGNKIRDDIISSYIVFKIIGNLRKSMLKPYEK